MKTNEAELDGLKLKTLISERGMRRSDLAERIGVSPTHLSRWCGAGKHVVRRENLVRLSQALNVAPDILQEPDPTMTTRLSQEEAELVTHYRDMGRFQRTRVWQTVEEVLKEEKPTP
jgi:transcriptional regulator with XRE-family HTH domain